MIYDVTSNYSMQYVNMIYSDIISNKTIIKVIAIEIIMTWKIAVPRTIMKVPSNI